MPKVFFGKEIPATQFLIDGSPVPFETLSRDMGVIALDSDTDKALVDVLNKTAGNRGVFKLSEAAYEELKKKPRETESLPPWHRANPQIRLAPSAQHRKPAAGPAVTEPAPVQEPPKGPAAPVRGFKPRTMPQQAAEKLGAGEK